MDDRNVVLTGFMGTGKTTVGKMLAERLDFEWVDSDALIESRHGAIPGIFARMGEDTFRAFERSTAYELAQRRRQVISTGGKLLLDFGNAYHLGRSGRIFCLTAEPATIVARLSEEGTDARPLLGSGDPEQRVRELLAERAAGYSRFDQVATDGKQPADVTTEILARIAAQPIS
jgi:shikimate kinase